MRWQDGRRGVTMLQIAGAVPARAGCRGRDGNRHPGACCPVYFAVDPSVFLSQAPTGGSPAAATSPA